DVADLRPRGQAGVGPDEEGEVPLAAARVVLRRQEASEHVRWQVGERVEGPEAGEDLAGLRVEVQRDLDLEVAAVVAHGLAGAEVPAAGRDGDEGIAEADLRELEGVPVERGGELVEHIDTLGRGGGGGVVLEVDAVGEQAAAADEVGRAEAAGSELLVGVVG